MSSPHVRLIGVGQDSDQLRNARDTMPGGVTQWEGLCNDCGQSAGDEFRIPDTSLCGCDSALVAVIRSGSQHFP